MFEATSYLYFVVFLLLRGFLCVTSYCFVNVADRQTSKCTISDPTPKVSPQTPQLLSATIYTLLMKNKVSQKVEHYLIKKL